MARFKATIEVKLESEKAARAVARSVTPDNLKTLKGLRVETKAKGNKVISVVECEKSFETFLATMDDLLACIQTAEKTLRVV